MVDFYLMSSFIQIHGFELFDYFHINYTSWTHIEGASYFNVLILQPFHHLFSIIIIGI